MIRFVRPGFNGQKGTGSRIRICKTGYVVLIYLSILPHEGMGSEGVTPLVLIQLIRGYIVNDDITVYSPYSSARLF
jgi:hypothetical protein